MKLKLNRKEQMAGDVVSFVFDAPGDFDWQPGQYLKWTLPHDNPDDRGVERWFTIAAPPFEHQPRITTRIVAERPSSFKVALNNLTPGDEVEAGEPEGNFVLGDESSKYVFIAGGIGFTPFHAILSELDHRGTMPVIQILYGATMGKPVFYDELERLHGRYPQLKVNYIVEPERINEAVIKQHVDDLSTPYFYISGPEPMVEAFVPMLEQLGVPKVNLRRDDFPGYTW